jgi:hypothetical protein
MIGLVVQMFPAQDKSMPPTEIPLAKVRHL